MDHIQDTCYCSKTPSDSSTSILTDSRKTLEHHTDSTDKESCFKISEKCMTEFSQPKSVTLFVDNSNDAPSQNQKNVATPESDRSNNFSCSQLPIPINERPILNKNPNKALSALPQTNLKGTLDVSKCTEENQQCIPNTPVDKKPGQSLECKIMDINTKCDSFHTGKHDSLVGEKKTEEMQNSDSSQPSTTEVEQHCKDLYDVLESNEHICSTVGKRECPFKKERLAEKTELYHQSSDCCNKERSKKDNEDTKIRFVCFSNVTRNTSHNDISVGSMHTESLSDCYSVQNGLENLEKYEHCSDKTAQDIECRKTGNDLTVCNQGVEQSSFEFLQSCFGISNLDHHTNPHKTDSQNSTDHTQSAFLVDATHKIPDTITRREPEQDMMHEYLVLSTDHNVQNSPIHRHHDTLEGKILHQSAAVVDGPDATSKMLSSKAFMYKLQPIVLLQTNAHGTSKYHYHCSVCQNSTHSLDEIIEHQNNKHSRLEIQHCPTCDCYFSDGISAARHSCKQTGPKHLQLAAKKLKKVAIRYKCRYCCKSFIKKSYYHDHEQRHIAITQHRCDVCGLYFSAASRLWSHKRKSKCNALVLEPKLNSKKSSESDLKNKDKPNGKSRLQDCFVKLVDINKQDKSSDNINCPYCDTGFNLRVEMKKHVNSHKDVQHLKCGKCNKLFTFPSLVEKISRMFDHKYKHNHTSTSVAGKYPCPICSRVFRYIFNVTRHLRRQCFKEYSQQGKGRVGDRYKCPLCSETFSAGGNRLRHVRNTCLKRYNARLLLNQENIEYNDEVNKDGQMSLSCQNYSNLVTLKCKFCEKCFSSSFLLKKHLKRHKGNRPFLCLTCGKTFKKQNHLVVHKNIHARRIQCSVCKKILPTIEDLLKHRKFHIKKGLLYCPDCQMPFKSTANFLRHIATHKNKSTQMLSEASDKESKIISDNTSAHKSSLSDHQITDQAKNLNEHFCKICQKAFVDSKTLSEHCLIHQPKVSDLKCPFCKRLYSCRISLIRHIRIHTGEKPFQCQKCGLHFRRKEARKLHLKKCEGTQIQPKTLPESKTNMLDKTKFKCSYCPHVFRGCGNLKFHERAHLMNNLLPCLLCGRYYKKKKFYKHRRICQGNDLHAKCSEKSNDSINHKEPSKEMGKLSECKNRLREQCPYCFKGFQFKCYLLRHLKTHLKKKHYSQPVNESDERIKAMLQYSDDVKCNFCTKTFNKYGDLRHHILTHVKFKLYNCKMCDSSFFQSDHLKIHKALCKGKSQRLEVRVEKITPGDIGTGWQNKMQSSDDALKCNICCKEFTSSNNLNRHVAMQHPFKPFSCARCNKMFSSKASFLRHNYTLNCKESFESSEIAQMPNKLIASPQPFKETPKLLEQLAGHFSKKYKYKCNYCPRHFKMPSQLNMHTRLHTGEKPYACKSCGERFIRNDYLQRHLLKCGQTGKCLKVLCDRCGALFTQEDLVDHKTNCKISDSAALPPDITSAESSSKIKAFSCIICEDQFLLFSQLQQHILTKHKKSTDQQGLKTIESQQFSSVLPVSEETVDDEYSKDHYHIPTLNGLKNAVSKIDKPFKCMKCCVNFPTKNELVTHMRTHLFVYPLSCKKCNKGFWKKTVLHRHRKKCMGLNATTMNPTKSVILFKKSTNTTGTGVLQTTFLCKGQNKGETHRDNAVHKYQCSECDKSFTDGLRLISHLEAHGREDQQQKEGKKYNCQHCGQTYDQAGLLQTHIKNKHPEILTHTCLECFKTLRSPSELVIHGSLHDPTRPFVCTTCQSRFWTARSLKIHHSHAHGSCMLLETKSSQIESPEVYTCSPCNKTYTVKRSYMKHCKSKHTTCAEGLVVSKSSMEQNLSKKESDGNNVGDVSDNDSDSAPYFPCHVCGKTFPTSESLEDHQKCHLGEKPYECEECGKCFLQFANLQQHQRSHKSEFQCQMCGKGFITLWALRKHKHSHVRKHPYQCTKCQLGFSKAQQLAEHITTHREENFPCDLCAETFSCKLSRAEHRKTHTQIEDELPPLIPSIKQTLPPALLKAASIKHPMLYCETCHIQFTDPEQLSEHVCNSAKELPYTCIESNKHFLHGSHLKKHQLTHQLSGTHSFKCNTCHLSFKHHNHFLTHLQTHGHEFSPESQLGDMKLVNTSDVNHDRIYKCPICPESFSQALELANHLSVHSHMCNVCNKTFPNKQQLEEHQQSHLTAATQYECTECKRNFIGSDAFRRHQCYNQKRPFSKENFSHSSLSPPKKQPSLETSIVISNDDEEDEVDVGEDFDNCPTCHKRFSSTYNLQEHQKLHKDDRPFKCLVCKKGFAKKKYLKQHQETHNEKPYRCDSCSDSFKTESAFLSHQKTHDVTRKHHCSICTKSYRSPSELARHQKKHPELQDVSEESGSHRCEMCYKSFSHLTQLHKHQETHVGQIVYECTECDKAFAFLNLLEQHQKSHTNSVNSANFQSQSNPFFKAR